MRNISVIFLVLALVGCGGGHAVRGDSGSRGGHRGNGRGGNGRQAGSAADAVAPASVRQMSDPGWVEVGVSVVGTEQESISSARNRALCAARREAIQSVSGISVTSGFISLQSNGGAESRNMVQALDFSRCNALIVDERRPQEKVANFPGGFRLDLKLQAKVLNIAEKTDPDFAVEVDIGDRRFIDGETLELSIRPSIDARIIAVSVTDMGAVVLVPNQHMPDTFVAARQWLRFPGPELTGRGLVVKAQIPSGVRSVAESLIVIAVRADAPIRGWDNLAPADGTFRAEDGGSAFRMLGDVFAPLADLAPQDWTMQQIPYEIVAH